MKRILNIVMAFALLATPGFWLNCDGGNPLDLNDPSTFPGTYNLVSVTDKAGDLGVPGATYSAGEIVQAKSAEGSYLAQITGGLVLTETRYTIQTLEINTSFEFLTDTDMGTYSISGFTLSTVSDEGGTETYTIGVKGNRLTLENDEIKIVVEKQ